MIFKKIKFITLLLTFLIFGYQQLHSQTSPKLTVVIVIDQFAYHYIPKLKHHFKYGMKTLLDEGIVYENAHHPQGAPSTPVGHATFNTGTFAKDHGVVFGEWYDENGNNVKWEDDDSPDAAVFSKDGLYDFGKSTKNLMVDTLADQFVLKSEPSKKHKSISLTHKTYSALAMAGHLGKAIWFDFKTGYFTSSKAFYEKLPNWVDQFNKEKKIDELTQTSWKLLYPKNSNAYNFKYINNYDDAGYKSSLIKEPQKFGPSNNSDFSFYEKTPGANQLLLDLAKKCIDTKFKKDVNLLLWISLGSLDSIGHDYGPNSFEIIDMIYHLDKQIGDFMQYAQKTVGDKNVLFVLTADHGVPPIPEIMHKDGYKNSIRIQTKPLIEEMNKLIENKYQISDIVIGFKKIHFFLNIKKLATAGYQKKNQILRDLKKFLQKQPGMKKVWTDEELNRAVFEPYQLEYFFQQQRYPGRSGQLICQPEPYCVLTTYETGTSHRTPYEYDTHVPLIIYKKGDYQKKIIQKKVWLPQLPVTLAKILKVQKPSASTFDILPGVN